MFRKCQSLTASLPSVRCAVRAACSCRAEQPRRCLTLGLAVMLVPALSAIPVRAQSAVPPTARQAVASGLAPHPTAQQRAQANSKLRGGTRSYGARPLPQDNISYANGPVNGLCDVQGCTVDAWGVNFGYAVTNSFPGASMTGFQFAVWAYPGDVLQTIDYSTGNTPFSGTSTTVSVSSQFQFSNQFGYDVDVITVSGLHDLMGQGTYWLTLQNAVTFQGNPIYWDENNGPSQAQESALGTIPSESFNIEGGTCDDSNRSAAQSAPTSGDITTNDYDVLYRFSGGDDGSRPDNLSLDKEGNIYGIASPVDECGSVFKLTGNESGSYTFHPIYSFTGGNDGCGLSSSMLVGSDGVLYGTTLEGGGTGCDGLGCGTIFSLGPPPTTCQAVMCPWSESQLYRFQGDADGFFPSNPVFDRAGNLYFLVSPGAYGFGAVDKLTPSGTGWIKSTVYDFRGTPDGAYPNGLVIDNAGNLFGTTGVGGIFNNGTIFELTPSGSGWTETVIRSMEDIVTSPHDLTIDTYGSLYGYFSYFAGGIFKLSPSDGSWRFSVVHNFNEEDGAPSSLAWSDAGFLIGTTIQGGCDLDRLGMDGGCSLQPGGSVHSLTGSQAGTLFTLDPNGEYNLEYQFYWGSPNGAFPNSTVASPSNGYLIFGSTMAGGDPSGQGYGCGVVYSYQL